MNGFTPRYAEKRCWQLLKERSVEYESLATSKRLVRLLIGSGQRGNEGAIFSLPRWSRCCTTFKLLVLKRQLNMYALRETIQGQVGQQYP